MSVDTSKECLLGNPKWQCGSLNLLFNMFTSYGAIQMTYVTWEDFLIVGFFLRNQSIWSMLSKLSKLFVFLPYYPFDFCRDCNNISELCPSVYVVFFFFFYVSLPRRLSILLIFSKYQHLIARIYLNGFLFVLHFIDLWS